MDKAFEVPSSFYYVAGFLIISNLSVLASAVVLVFKAGLFVAETKSNITKAQDTANRAHKRVDKLEEKYSQ